MLSEHVVKQQRKHKRDELRDDGVEGVGNREVDRILGNGAVGNGLHAVAQIGDAALDSVAVGIGSGEGVAVLIGRVVPLGIWRLIWVPPMVTTRQPTTKTPMMEAARVKACMLAVRASIALVPSL